MQLQHRVHLEEELELQAIKHLVETLLLHHDPCLMVAQEAVLVLSPFVSISSVHLSVFYHHHYYYYLLLLVFIVKSNSRSNSLNWFLFLPPKWLFAIDERITSTSASSFRVSAVS